MGKFSGILICTDFDNSLVYNLKMPERNVEAIKYFKENGGLFTVISGRSQEVLNRIETCALPNTYLGTFNGTVIYDPENKCVLDDNFMADTCFAQMMELRERYDDFTVTACARDKFITAESGDADYEDKMRECRSRALRKYYVHREKCFNDEAYRDICALFAPDYEVTRSSIKGVEIQSKGVNKASAALKIKELTGSRLLVCVGDFENDISMVKAADIGYAVENACESLKAVADRMTVHCKDGALAAIIAELEAEL